MKHIAEKLRSLADSHELPSPEYLGGLLDSVCAVLDSENASMRPRDGEGLPGGLVLTQAQQAVIVPDLHARTGLLADLLAAAFPGAHGASVESLLSENRAALICLGDLLHSEGKRAAERWSSAARLALDSEGPGGILSAQMDEEMGASLRTLCVVLELKLRFPGAFHCLKGNHDNMSNTAQNGDLPFYKYAAEGSMGAAWFVLRYGNDLLSLMRRYERSLPLVAHGRRYCASHAEPAFPMGPERITNYRSDPELVQALIWTGNDEAAPGSVEKSMASLLGADLPQDDWIWISGHRAVAGNFSLRAQGLLAQIHNPARRQAAVLDDSDIGTSRADIYAIQPGEGGEASRLVFAQSIPRLRAGPRPA
jgi:hypothetical protein